MPNPQGTRDHAVVIGAGVAGLAAAAALAVRYAQVTVLDRDALPDVPAPRKGVPQSPHGHVLLAAGERALGTLFPGLTKELVEGGAVPFDPGTDLVMRRWGTRWLKIPTGLDLVSFSRPFLEWTLRERLAAGKAVAFRDRTAVSGLEGVNGTVTGVRLDDGTRLDCDLVVDCSGRGSRSDRWLAELDMPAPAVTEVKVNVGYASRLFRREPGDLDDAVGWFALPAPPHERRAGLALPVEGDRWLISLGGWHGDFPAADEESYAAHAKSLPLPRIAQLIAEREPLSKIETTGYAGSRRRHFAELPRVPGGYVALGDSLCSFNPVYGQGMACAALEAVALGELLDRHEGAGPELVRAFYREAVRITTTPWQFAAGGDFAYPETRGRRPRGIGLLNAFGRELQIAAGVDPRIRRLYVSVQQLLTPPSALRRPGTVWRILTNARRERRALAETKKGAGG